MTINRRSTIHTPPQTLLVMAKRFEMDYEVFKFVKTNDLFEFPMSFNLTPYTKEGLEAAEAGEDPPEEIMYELHGVIIHSGTVEMGHYYSYIRERGTDKWFKFDDDCVSPFNPEDLPELAFGGEVTETRYDSKTGRRVEQRKVRSYNAYVLVYDKVVEPTTPRSPDSLPASPLPSTPGQTQSQQTRELLPADVKRFVFQDNVSFVQDCLTFGEDYAHFMLQLAFTIEMEPCQDYDVEPTRDLGGLWGLQLLTKHTVETLAHSRDWDSLEPMVRRLKELYSQCLPGCKWLLTVLSLDTHWLTTLLLECPEALIREHLCDLILHVMAQLAPHERHLYNAPPPEDGTEQPSLVKRIFKVLLEMLDDARKYWAHFVQYFRLIHGCARLGDEEWTYLHHHQMVFRLGDFLLGNESPVNRPRKHSGVKMGGWAQPNFTPLLECMHLFVCRAGGRVSELDDRILKAPKFWWHALMNSHSPRVVAEMLAARCETDKDFSELACDIVADGAFPSLHSLGVGSSDADHIAVYLQCIWEMILIEDNMQQGRIQVLLNDRDGFLYHAELYSTARSKVTEICTYKCIKWLVNFVKEHELLDDWLKVNGASWQWMGEWLELYCEEKRDEQSFTKGKNKKQLIEDLHRVHSSGEILDKFRQTSEKLDIERADSPFLNMVGGHFDDYDSSDPDDDLD